ncbi:hypothetical protein [Corynebacterium epidermidicanis]|uniref:SIS domain-containing protein n=1 Tax=Corynebacterium epidermidicanis TaxID=1050174 RepID=A0A0G3GUG7_9CORY|nr:hypothetical protein [Corynebacterium epidermidicanis]AKK02527.1 hypothetical protein CEPID_03235 [Corynebacterium epidermidicanis]
MYDPAAVQFYDIAHSGAHLRSIANFLRSADCAELEHFQLRSFVVLAPDDEARSAAELALAELGVLDFPIVVATQLPTYVGPLDVVLVVSQRGTDLELEHALSSASGRGATTLLIAPSGAPLIDDASDRVTIIPGLPNSPEVAISQVCAAVLGVSWLVQLGVRCASEQLDELADAVDDELTRVAPDRDPSVNLAQQLRESLDGHRILHTGHGALARLLATYWTAHGLLSAALSISDLPQALPRLQQAAPDVFYDPFEDGPAEVLPLRVVVWGAHAQASSQAIVQECTPPAASRHEEVFRLLVRGLAVTALTD